MAIEDPASNNLLVSRFKRFMILIDQRLVIAGEFSDGFGFQRFDTIGQLRFRMRRILSAVKILQISVFL